MVPILIHQFNRPNTSPWAWIGPTQLRNKMKIVSQQSPLWTWFPLNCVTLESVSWRLKGRDLSAMVINMNNIMMHNEEKEFQKAMSPKAVTSSQTCSCFEFLLSRIQLLGFYYFEYHLPSCNGSPGLMEHTSPGIAYKRDAKFFDISTIHTFTLKMVPVYEPNGTSELFRRKTHSYHKHENWD